MKLDSLVILLVCDEAEKRIPFSHLNLARIELHLHLDTKHYLTKTSQHLISQNSLRTCVGKVKTFPVQKSIEND